MFSLERMKFLQYPAVCSLTCIQALQMTGQGQKSLEESHLFLLPLHLLPLPPTPLVAFVCSEMAGHLFPH